MIEALGAFLASAPLRDSRHGLRTRQVAFALVTTLFFVGALLIAR